jgi:hypothetical protein
MLTIANDETKKTKNLFVLLTDLKKKRENMNMIPIRSGSLLP